MVSSSSPDGLSASTRRRTPSPKRLKLPGTPTSTTADSSRSLRWNGSWTRRPSTRCSATSWSSPWVSRRSCLTPTNDPRWKSTAHKPNSRKQKAGNNLVNQQPHPRRHRRSPPLLRSRVGAELHPGRQAQVLRVADHPEGRHHHHHSYREGHRRGDRRWYGQVRRQAPQQGGSEAAAA